MLLLNICNMLELSGLFACLFFGGEDLLSDSSGWCTTGAVYTIQNNETCIPQIPKKFRGVS